jgi:hypothetical protein
VLSTVRPEPGREGAGRGVGEAQASDAQTKTFRVPSCPRVAARRGAKPVGGSLSSYRGVVRRTPWLDPLGHGVHCSVLSDLVTWQA